ncbi:MAG: TfoX/Sxy family protein, partial [Myxococcales bacterium]|nr:TfoX/Sxy family protein [Myxococcales bacterium]
MAYDEKLAGRVREVLARRRGVTEKKMFGGLSFLVNGHMCCGIVGDDLMVRVGPDAYEGALKKKGARPMDFTG